MLKEIIEAYTKSAEYEALSPNSKKTYNHYLNKFVLSKTDSTLHKSPMQIGVGVQNDVAFLSSVVRSFNGPQGQRMARRVLVLLMGWAQSYSLVNYNPAVKIPLPKLTIKPRLPFNITEINTITALLQSGEVPPKWAPYVAQGIVAFHTGMRPSELDNLEWADVGPEFIQVRSAKHQEVGAVARMVRVTDKVKQIIPNRSQGLVFKSLNGKKLNKDTRSEAIHYACTKTGIPAREFYSTRRGTATEMFKAGYDISAIQHQLGHRDISTTQIYIKPTMEQAASVFRGF
jgi:integrase